MADAVAICNLALSYIGDSASVATIDPPDQTTTSQMCAIMYPRAVSTLLERFDWSFATKHVELSEFSDRDTAGWKHVFALPSDCMRAIRVRSKNRQHTLFPKSAGFEIGIDGDNRVLYTDVATPVLTYITSNVNEANFTEGFTSALAWYLASTLAGQRIKGREGYTMAQNLMQRYEVAMAEAKRLDASQQHKRMPFIPKQIEVR